MTRIRIACLMIGVAVCACGGPGSETDPDGGDNGGGGGGGGGGSATETKAGTFTITSNRYTISTTMIEQGYATGTMYRIPPVSSGGGSCSNTSYGACDVQTCDVVTPTTDGGIAITYTDSGPIEISGVEVNDGTMTLTPGAYGYVTVSGAVALFTGGSTVRWVAPGNTSGGPAFDVSLVAPTAVQVTSPTFVQGKVSASSTQDLAVAWSGATGAVTVQLTGGGSGHSASARCTFNGTSGVVPAAAIAAVRSAGGAASIMISSESHAEKTPDGWKLTFSLQSYGLIPSGVAVGTLLLN